MVMVTDTVLDRLITELRLLCVREKMDQEIRSNFVKHAPYAGSITKLFFSFISDQSVMTIL